MASDADGIPVGIVGFGRMGRLRHELLRGEPRLRVVAVADPDPSARATAAATGARVHARYGSLLEDDVAAVVVCVPAALAAEITAAALARDLHVLCEKPPGTSSAEVAAVRDVEARHPRARLAYAFNHRRHGSVRRAMEIVGSGNLGRVLAASAVYGKPRLTSDPSSWRAHPALAGGGILLDQGIHAADLLRWFVGEPEHVQACIAPDPVVPALEGNVVATFRSAGGGVASLVSSATLSPPTFALDVLLEGGTLRLRGILSQSRAYEPETLEVHRATGDPPAPPERSVYDRDDSWREEIAEFAGAVRDGARLSHGDSLEAYRTMNLLDRIYAADPSWSGRNPG